MEKLCRQVSLIACIRLIVFDCFSMKYVDALKYVLENAPVRAKDGEKKVFYPWKISCENLCVCSIEKSSAYGFVNDDENQSK